MSRNERTSCLCVTAMQRHWLHAALMSQGHGSQQISCCGAKLHVEPRLLAAGQILLRAELHRAAAEDLHGGGLARVVGQRPQRVEADACTRADSPSELGTRD